MPRETKKRTIRMPARRKRSASPARGKPSAPKAASAGEAGRPRRAALEFNHAMIYTRDVVRSLGFYRVA
jgi:hypothetical protein